MSIQITTAMIDGYTGEVDILLRQSGSKLRPYVMSQPIKGKRDFFEQVGASSTRAKTTRHQDIEYGNTEHARRSVAAVVRYAADLIDSDDRARILFDPANEYAMAQADALGADWDDIIITAMHGIAYTGADGTTQTAYDTGMTVANNVREPGVSDAAYGLNVAKLRRAKKLMDVRHVAKEDRYIGVNGAAMESLLGTTRATSADYANVKALVNGDIDTFLGFKFVDCQRLVSDGTYDQIPYWHKSGVKVGIHQDVSSRMDYVTQKVARVLQVHTWFDIGATRMQEGKVGLIECHPTNGAGG